MGNFHVLQFFSKKLNFQSNYIFDPFISSRYRPNSSYFEDLKGNSILRLQFLFCVGGVIGAFSIFLLLAIR